MPYVTKNARDKYDIHVRQLSQILAGAPAGELNYVLMSLFLDHFAGAGVSYENIATHTGVLHNMADEFNRRSVVPYEDSKCRVNGDLGQFAGSR